MVAPPPPPPPPMYDHMDDNSDSEENNSTHSADLHIEGINDHRREEDRLTEAEKNERVQKQLKVREIPRCFLPQLFRNRASQVRLTWAGLVRFATVTPPAYRGSSPRWRLVCLLHVLHSNFSLFHTTDLSISVPPSDLDTRAGPGARRIQRHPERPPSQRQRQGRPGQIQDAATDPAGQHKAEDRRVWSHVEKKETKEHLGPSDNQPFLTGHSVSLFDWHTLTRGDAHWSGAERGAPATDSPAGLLPEILVPKPSSPGHFKTYFHYRTSISHRSPLIYLVFWSRRVLNECNSPVLFVF